MCRLPHLHAFPVPEQEKRKDQDKNKDQCRQGIHFRMDSQFQFGIDFRRQRIDSGTFGKVGNDEIISRHSEGQHKTRLKQAGPQFRQDAAGAA